MENGILDGTLSKLEPRGDYLLVNPATNLIGQDGFQWLNTYALATLYVIAQRFRARTGKALYIREAFRSLYTQRYYVANPPSGTVAPAGTSIHGWGLAIDVWSAVDQGFNTPEHVAFEQIAAEYGWVNTGRNFGTPEPWHFEFKPTASSTVIDPASGGETTPIGEEDMDISDADIQKIATAVWGKKIQGDSNPTAAAILSRADERAGKAVAAFDEVPQQVWAFKLGGMLWSASTFIQRIGKALGLDATKP